jgi:hypothetical protein
MFNSPLHLFYEEPDPDRWFLGDRYPRRLVRHLLRGKEEPGGVKRWFLNLQAGLDQLGVVYRLNDYRSLRRHPGAVACVIGKHHVINKIPDGHPIVYGPGIAAHPYDSDFWDRKDIAKIIISCQWFKEMYERDLPRPIPTAVWPAGVETHLWTPTPDRPHNSILVYDKVRWRRDEYEVNLINPIIRCLRNRGYNVTHLRYGYYREENFKKLLQTSSAMVFLCEHETQGFAYLQALSCGVPILAWDRGGPWQDPSMFPLRVNYGPVTSVPYFDPQCGIKFSGIHDFDSALNSFINGVSSRIFQPRDYVLKNFNLSTRAQEYLDLVAPFRCSH